MGGYLALHAADPGVGYLLSSEFSSIAAGGLLAVSMLLFNSFQYVIVLGTAVSAMATSVNLNHFCQSSGKSKKNLIRTEPDLTHLSLNKCK